MLQSEHELLEPGMRVRVGPRLMGHELYGADDPAPYKKWCGKEVTVSKVDKPDHWMVYIEEDDGVCFFMEEIECVIEDAEISESEEPINVLLGCVV